jgi:hypothetical protein
LFFVHIQDFWRKRDFEKGIIKECYVVYGKKPVKITKGDMDRDKIKALKP